MAKITIDFFELAFLAEACIPPRPIARACFWDRLINEIYGRLSSGERAKLYEWITQEDNFKPDEKNCAWFAARYDPNNQYWVETDFKGKKSFYECFLKDSRYYTSKDIRIDERFITKVVKIEVKQ